jgi:hypothetical protein
MSRPFPPSPRFVNRPRGLRHDQARRLRLAVGDRIVTAPKPLTPWQAQNLPPGLPLHIRRNIRLGEHGCWLWTRSRSPDGYGWASLDNRTYQAHRLIWTLLRSDPGDLQLDHLCRVRHCVNPDHLEPVTGLINLRRSPLTTAGAVLCAKGHVLVQMKHQRRCPVCLAEYEAARREQKIEYCRRWRQERRV